MQSLWSQLEASPDLFTYWEKEVRLRHNFRKDYSIDHIIKLENMKQIDFLYRSLYLVNRQNDFYIMLIANSNKTFALNWLKEAGDSLITDFLQYIPRYILEYSPRTTVLQFLIHIYNPKYDSFFMPIIDLMDQEECQFFISKTANRNLRNLLKSKKDQLESEEKGWFYGLNLKNPAPLPTLYGDKLALITQAINYIHRNRNYFEYSPTYPQKYFTDLLSFAELLFEIGLVADSLHMLLLIYQHYEKDNKSLDFTEDEIIFKTFNKQVRRVLPIYALLYQAESFNFSLQFYHQNFPRLTPDLASLTYMKIYEKLHLAAQDFSTTILDSYPEILKIKQIRPDETALLYEHELTEKMTSQRFSKLLNLAETKLASLPHEAFITLDLLKNLLQHGWTADTSSSDIIATNYLELFSWLPCPLFINNLLVTELNTHTSPRIKEEVEKHMKLLDYYNSYSIWQDITEKPDLIKNETIRRLIFTGKFTGVL